MNQPQRFKDVHDPKGQLVALGSTEVPSPEAKQRVAQRLGISAAAIAAAATATAVAPSATAAVATSGAKAMGSVAAGLSGTTSSFVATTIVKATVIGLVLGVASFSGVKVYTSLSTPGASSVTVVRPLPGKHEQATVVEAVDLPATPASSQDIVPGPSVAIPHANPSSSGNIDRTTTTKEPVQVSNRADPAALPVARFADVEPPAVPSAAVPLGTTEASRWVPLHNTGAVPPTSASTMPVDPRLAREVASLDRARASAHRGEPAAALREINSFEKSYGYVALRKESMLVNIDVLLSLGRRADASVLARQLLLAGAPANQRARLEELANAHP